MKELQIGDKITANYSYNKKCSNRFTTGTDGRQNVLTPLHTNFTGYIIGKRHVIMQGYRYNHDADEQAYVSGQQEQVWLVVKGIRNNPEIVRDQDITKVEP